MSERSVNKALKSAEMALSMVDDETSSQKIMIGQDVSKNNIVWENEGQDICDCGWPHVPRLYKAI